MPYEIQLVCLYRCKSCGIRVFEEDMQGHLKHHGIYANGETRKYFARGARDTPQKPGFHHKQIYQSHGQKRKTT